MRIFMRMAEIHLMARSPNETITFATDSQREVIIGRTGSGKTQYGLWRLSHRSFDAMPWIIFDYKGDALIDAIEPTEISFHKPPPKNPGLYVVRPIPKSDDSAIEDYLWKIWGQGRTGCYFDEGYLVPAKGALQGIMTQGRSKFIPTMTLIQRPCWIDNFIFSEADYFTIFNLGRRDDRKKVREETTDEIPINYRRPSFYSYYYDVGNDTLRPFSPAPSREVILGTFQQRLGERRRHL